MALKHKTHDIEKASTAQRAPEQQEETARSANESVRPVNPAVALQRAASSHPSALRPADIHVLQRTMGNRAVRRIFSQRPQALLTPPSSTPASAIQRKAEEEEPLQAKLETDRGKENRTGLPDKLKAGIERLSGMTMDDVRVHYNSSKPAEVQALAYTRGSEIYVAPGQERHLAHEAWHVVQQKEGRVSATAQVNGLRVNDQQSLEHEADAFGSLATGKGQQDTTHRQDEKGAEAMDSSMRRTSTSSPASGERVLQMVGGWEIKDETGKILNNTVVEAVYSQRQQSRAPAPHEAANLPAYVANVPAVASDTLNLANVANKYRDEGFAAQNDADLRLAMVFGVNRYRNAQTTTEQTMATARQNFTANLGNFNHFPVAVISFLWDPQWAYLGQGRTIAQVRQAYTQGNNQTREDIAETQTKKFAPGKAQRVVPYGEIRDKIKSSAATAAFQQRFAEFWPQVYVHTGDADVTSLHVSGAAPGQHQFTEVANTGLFAYIDQRIAAKAQALAQAALNQKLEDEPNLSQEEQNTFFNEKLVELLPEAMPDVMTGGYNFRLRPESGAANTTIDDYLTMLASRLDFTVRAAMARLDPRAIYFPEPNTFYKADAYLGGLFGSGHEEGRKMLKSLLDYNLVKSPKLAFLPGAAVGTDPTRFSVGLGKTMVSTQRLTKENIAALFGLTQSHARKNTWADQLELIVKARFDKSAATGPLQELYEAAFPQEMTDGTAAAINAKTDGDIEHSVDAYLQQSKMLYDNNKQKTFLANIAKASGKATLGFLKALIANWPGAQ